VEQVVSTPSSGETTHKSDFLSHYEQEGNETVVKFNQRNQAETLGPKGTGERAGIFGSDRYSPRK
jgi:hypothetical protein